jgi:hypothetical protein
MTKVKVSPKDELLLPKSMMDAHGFTDGAEVEVSGDANQIVLRLVRGKDQQSEKTLSVMEFLARRPIYKGPPVTQEMIDQAILDEAEHRWNEKNSH